MVWLSTLPFLLLGGRKCIFWWKEKAIPFVFCDIIYCFYKVQPVDGFSSFRWSALSASAHSPLLGKRILCDRQCTWIQCTWYAFSISQSCISHTKEDITCLVIEQFLFTSFYSLGSWQNLWNKFVEKTIQLEWQIHVINFSGLELVETIELFYWCFQLS